MNVFILGLPYSGKTTVAKAIEKSLGLIHVNVSDWIVRAVREQFHVEHEQQFKEKLQEVYFDLLKQDPTMCISHAHEVMVRHGLDKNYIIEGIVTPKDFIHLFNINDDIVVFLNRTDNGEYYQDHDNIALPTMKDYCFWMSSGGLLPKNKWLEYNFKIPGEESDYIKILGSKNSVFLVKSIDKVISHLDGKLKELFV
jgi:AAA domain-containing protein